MNNKVVLAFSGGLDTSYCVKYLKDEQRLEVHTATVNTGGFSAAELEAIEHNAMELGAASYVTLEETDAYYQQCVKYLIFGNVLRNGTYPLSVSAERVFQAIAIANYAKKIGASYIAHGSTGAGNDQVRFDLVFHILCPEIQVITPIRDQSLSRQAEIDYLTAKGVKRDWTKAQYSINQGLWGTSVGGKETLTSHQSLPEHAYPSQLQKEEPSEVVLHFDKGELIGVNGDFKDPVSNIQYLEELAAPYAIGRDYHVGDTIIGIKGRIGFEAAASYVIIKAHHQLEKHTLTKWQLYWKEQLANWYGMMVHEGTFLDPVMRNIEKFLDDTQTNVSGKVRVALMPYRFQVQGIESEHDLMNSTFGKYGEENSGWSGDDVKGFTKILANGLKIYHAVNEKGQEV
ncbi:argininosuccinate synthase [Flammeovirgaceae bacterium 311]|nr:argininosuccinate synthase [Flammeovirgaceae bacterium 311]